jgi:hypothetical protein
VTIRYVVICADRSGNSWDGFKSNDLSEALIACGINPDGQGVWDNSTDAWVSSEDIDEELSHE